MRVMVAGKTGEWLKKHRIREKKIASTVMGRALITIDRLTSLDEPQDARLRQIYRIAHSAAGLCEAGHPDWLKEIDEVYKELADR